MADELVLIVDDNERNVKLTRDVLRFAGFRTLEAATGTEGISLAAEYLSTHTGFPYGRYDYIATTHGYELYISNVPLFVPVSFGTVGRRLPSLMPSMTTPALVTDASNFEFRRLPAKERSRPSSGCTESSASMPWA